MAHALDAGTLPAPRSNPFGRMVMAQSFLTGYPVVTTNPIVFASSQGGALTM